MSHPRTTDGLTTFTANIKDATEPLVLLRHVGPEMNPEAPAMGA